MIILRELHLMCSFTFPPLCRPLTPINNCSPDQSGTEVAFKVKTTTKLEKARPVSLGKEVVSGAILQGRPACV